MITSIIGRIFLEAYNKKFNAHYDAKNFFVEQYCPLFFGHEKYMMTAGNSPLENPKISWDKMIREQLPFESEERRKERFNALISKIETNYADASIAIGYPTLDINSTTSGQVSNINMNTSKDEVYLSWIGAGFGIGVQGGFSILFNNVVVLFDIFEGWNIYRKILDETPNLKGNQINTWNGQWLAHKYNKHEYIKDNYMANFNPYIIKDNLMSIDTQSWTKIIIAISGKIKNPQMMGYIYNYGQTNTTIGFIPFALDEIRRPIDMYQHLFGTEEGRKAEELYGTAFGFITACKAGAIGVKAMEPKGLRDYMEKGKMPKYDGGEEQIIKFHTYIIWILAMLKNEEMWAKAQEFAHEMQIYSQNADRGKVGSSRKVDAVMQSTSKTKLIESLVDVVADAANKDKIEEVAALINAMPNDNVQYFMVLVKFHYASINNIKK
jgi:hypothetical protein